MKPLRPGVGYTRRAAAYPACALYERDLLSLPLFSPFYFRHPITTVRLRWSLAAIGCLWLVWPLATSAHGSEQVRIGLFSLFQPEVLDVRPLTGSQIRLVRDGAFETRFEKGEAVRIKLISGHLQARIIDAHGRMRGSVHALQLVFASDGVSRFELVLPGRLARSVSGELMVSATRQAGHLGVVLTTDGESVVKSVVAAEMAASEWREALKALAVAVRTFIVANMGRHGREGFDFCDTTHCQVYRAEDDLGIGSAGEAVANAVASTEGEYLRFQGRLVEGYYTAACGGFAADPQMVWGGRPASGYPYQHGTCTWCSGSRYYRWTRRASIERVIEAISAATRSRLSNNAHISLVREGQVSFVRTVVIRDGQKELTMTADEFRRAIGHRLGWNTVLSPSFGIQRQGGTFIFNGRGFGSQIGMCIAGATVQARQGRDHRTILGFYYPQTEIVRQ